MIIKRILAAITIFLIINNIAIAANVDFKTLNNNAISTCANNQIKENCKNVNGTDSACQIDKSNDAATANEANKYEHCYNLKTDESYVEPKFSTKRPRGQ